MPRTESHKWEFRPRFRRHAFGRRSQPAIQRIRQAVGEIRKAARVDPVLGAEGGVTLLERLSPALENVDSSSGAVGTAVHNAIRELVAATPGDEGKWFAAAKEAGLYDDALALASRTPCDPRTLARAARDFAEAQPRFAVGAGLLALHWLVEGYGYDITSADVWAAYSSTMRAAERNGNADEVRARVRALVGGEKAGGFVSRVLGRELGP